MGEIALNSIVQPRKLTEVRFHPNVEDSTSDAVKDHLTELTTLREIISEGKWRFKCHSFTAEAASPASFDPNSNDFGPYGDLNFTVAGPAPYGSLGYIEQIAIYRLGAESGYYGLVALHSLRSFLFEIPADVNGLDMGMKDIPPLLYDALRSALLRGRSIRSQEVQELIHGFEIDGAY